MNPLALKHMFGAVIAPNEKESKETEYLIDLAENQVSCNDDLCGVSWKPVPANSDLNDKPSNS